jgi:hypothetical protein
VKNLAVEASGGSDLRGYDLVSDYVAVQASGGCNAFVTVNRELKVVASGGSGVFYKGPANIKQIISSGSSRVVKKG